MMKPKPAKPATPETPSHAPAEGGEQQHQDAESPNPHSNHDTNADGAEVPPTAAEPMDTDKSEAK